MIGLMFLSLAILWIALVVYLTIKIPRWCGVVRHAWLLRLLLVPLLLVGPFVDEIVGMRQFDELCKERTAIWMSPDAGQVKRAKRIGLLPTDVLGYWIEIRSQVVEYVDIDTGKTFVRYELLNTHGGRIAGARLMEGTISCQPKDGTLNSLIDIDKLVRHGAQP